MSQYLPIAAMVVCPWLVFIGLTQWSGKRITDFADTEPTKGTTA